MSTVIKFYLDGKFKELKSNEVRARITLSDYKRLYKYESHTKPEIIKGVKQMSVYFLIK